MNLFYRIHPTLQEGRWDQELLLISFSRNLDCLQAIQETARTIEVYKQCIAKYMIYILRYGSIHFNILQLLTFSFHVNLVSKLLIL